MLHPFVLLVLLQFVGEALARLGGVPVPGPVIGLALLMLMAVAVPWVFREVEETADTILRHLSLRTAPRAACPGMDGSTLPWLRPCPSLVSRSPLLTTRIWT